MVARQRWARVSDLDADSARGPATLPGQAERGGGKGMNDRIGDQFGDDQKRVVRKVRGDAPLLHGASGASADGGKTFWKGRQREDHVCPSG
ncbi:hypothetical protein GCM10010246_83930 [Streptomyces cuspidosporus]|uniref:Uncharacterized protein n=2 Tax=Streptomyces cuspidosporus TaxID=66882 RepID=A0ABN3HCR4_9ACTN